jgi:hypothetical protein
MELHAAGGAAGIEGLIGHDEVDLLCSGHCVR